MLCYSSYNKFPDSNTAAGTVTRAASVTNEFKCDNTVNSHVLQEQYCEFPCPARTMVMF